MVLHLSKLVIWGSSWGRGFRFHWLKSRVARKLRDLLRQPGPDTAGCFYVAPSARERLRRWQQYPLAAPPQAAPRQAAPPHAAPPAGSSTTRSTTCRQHHHRQHHSQHHPSAPRLGDSSTRETGDSRVARRAFFRGRVARDVLGAALVGMRVASRSARVVPPRVFWLPPTVCGRPAALPASLASLAGQASQAGGRSEQGSGGGWEWLREGADRASRRPPGPKAALRATRSADRDRGGGWGAPGPARPGPARPSQGGTAHYWASERHVGRRTERTAPRWL